MRGGDKRGRQRLRPPLTPTLSPLKDGEREKDAQSTIRMITSISTGMFPGSEPMPTAERA